MGTVLVMGGIGIPMEDKEPVVGRLKQIYFITNSKETELAPSSIVVLRSDGKTEELGISNTSHHDDLEYIKLVFGKYYHGNLQLPWNPRR